MIKIPFTLILLTLLFCCSEGHDYLYYVTTWPTTYCLIRTQIMHSKPCPLPIQTDNFTVLGIWDAYYNLTISQSFKKQPTTPSQDFDLSQVSHLETRLNTSWIYHDEHNNNQHIWRSEWLRKGSKLRNPTLSISQYFELGLYWWEKLDILSILKNNGLGPDLIKLHNADLVRKAIAATIGHDPVLICKIVGHQFYLAHVRICIDKFGSALVQCPSRIIEDDCGSKDIMFPSIERMSSMQSH